MVEKGYNHILICQDDLVFKEDFVNHFNHVMNHIPEDAEIVNIGFHKWAVHENSIPFDLTSTDNFNDIGASKVNDYVCHLKNGINPCSLAYIVTRQGAIHLIEHFNKIGFRKATDWNYNDYLSNKKIFYGTNIVLCTGNPNLGSDIFSNF
jgi:GR25 family glycosyltransferase involved in LPS biosynthesis